MRRLSIEPTFWLSLILLAIASVAWYFKLRRPRKGRDRLIQMIVITYYTFLAGAMLLLTAAVLIYLRVFQVDGFFYLSGVYTGCAIGFSVMLWTLVPALVLVYKGEHYRRVRDGLCLACAYDIRGVEGAACPECGHKIDKDIYREPTRSGAGPA